MRRDLGGQHAARAATGEPGQQGGLAARSRAQVQPRPDRAVGAGERGGDQLRTLVLYAGPALAYGGQVGRVARPAGGVRRVPAGLGPRRRQLTDLGQPGPDGQGDRGQLVVGAQRGLQLGVRQHVGERVDDPARVGGRDRQPVPLVQPGGEPVHPLGEVRSATRRSTAFTSPVTRRPTVAAARSTVAATAACTGTRMARS